MAGASHEAVEEVDVEAAEVSSRATKARLLITRSICVPSTRRHTARRRWRTRTAADCEKTKRGGSFFTGTACAFFSSPLMESAISSRSSDIVEGPRATVDWKAC
jgi:hypothetical protein